MEVLRTAILDFCRRRKEAGFSPSEVVQQLYPEDWELFLPELLAVITQMASEGLIELSPIFEPNSDLPPSRSNVLIKSVSKPN
jgi:hypothetical protein